MLGDGGEDREDPLYGLLWHGAEDLGSGKCRESLEAWFEAIGYLRLTMALYQALRESVWIGSTEPLRRLKFEAAMSDDIVSQLTDEIRLAVAHKTIARMITYGLRDAAIGIGPNVTDDEAFVPGRFVFSILPTNLLGAAWADLAHIVGARAEIATCPGCGMFFAPESGKQKYCTKSCASTSRWRRWNERQNE